MKIIAILLLASLPLLCFTFTFHDRKIFASKFGGKTRSLSDLKNVRTKIQNQFLTNLKALPETVKSYFLDHAEFELKQRNYPQKTVHDYMEYFRNGNRANYQTKLHRHRERLSYLVIGNLLDSEKNHTSMKYVDEIVNGVWMIMEESTWCQPAALFHQNTTDQLPTPGHVGIDLNAGEISKTIGWIKLLMADKFDRISTVINKRIDHELRTRIFQAYLDNDYRWSGYNVKSHKVNNHNIWHNGDTLKSAIFTLDDMALFDKFLNRTVYSADYFVDIYGEDGGCDEGPTYWRHAGGRLIEYLELLEHLFEDGRKYFEGLPLIRRIGEYSYKMRITSNWFVNYADASPVVFYPPSLLYKYGELYNDDVMRKYAAFMMGFPNPGDLKNGVDTGALPTNVTSSYFIQAIAGGDFNEFCNSVNTYAGILEQKAAAPELQQVWLPDIQVVNVRSKKEAKNQLFLGAKAGHNDESHNHNDVGSFVLYQNGHPVVLDIGVGMYTSITFSPRRYELFYMQSQYHNCPTINGVQQHNGKKFTSRNVTFVENSESHGNGIHFSADIAHAYPAEAHVKHWTRSFEFNRDSNSVRIDDKYTLDKFIQPQQMHFILPNDLKTEKTEKGLRLRNTNVDVEMKLDWTVFDMKEELKSMDGDVHLTRTWGESVKRLTLVTKPSNTELKGHFVIRFLAGI